MKEQKSIMVDEETYALLVKAMSALQLKTGKPEGMGSTIKAILKGEAAPAAGAKAHRPGMHKEKGES